MIKQDIIDAWRIIRETNESIPDEVLDFMRLSALEALTPDTIELDDIEKKLILLCKNHFKDKYPFGDGWVDTLKPFYNDHYGFNADERPKAFKECMFFKLLAVQVKLAENEGHRRYQTREMFAAAFDKSFARYDELPIERAISMVCGIIQCATYLDENKNPRYSLELEEE